MKKLALLLIVLCVSVACLAGLREATIVATINAAVGTNNVRLVTSDQKGFFRIKNQGLATVNFTLSRWGTPNTSLNSWELDPGEIYDSWPARVKFNSTTGLRMLSQSGTVNVFGFIYNQ
jgi:hypothetical protein